MQSTLITRATLVPGATLLHAVEGYALTMPLTYDGGQTVTVEVVGRENAALAVRLPQTEGIWLAFPQDVIGTDADAEL